MIGLRIEPQPSPDEAAAIEAAVNELVARHAGTATSLRYGNVSDFRAENLRSWSAVARLEALAPSV